MHKKTVSEDFRLETTIKITASEKQISNEISRVAISWPQELSKHWQKTGVDAADKLLRIEFLLDNLLLYAALETQQNIMHEDRQTDHVTAYLAAINDIILIKMIIHSNGVSAHLLPQLTEGDNALDIPQLAGAENHKGLFPLAIAKQTSISLNTFFVHQDDTISKRWNRSTRTEILKVWY